MPDDLPQPNMSDETEYKNTGEPLPDKAAEFTQTTSDSSYTAQNTGLSDKLQIVFETHQNWVVGHKQRIYDISERADATLLVLTGFVATLDRQTVEPFRWHFTGAISVVVLYGVISIAHYSHRYHSRARRLNLLFQDLLGSLKLNGEQSSLLTHPSFNLRGTLIRAVGHSGTVVLLASVCTAVVWGR